MASLRYYDPVKNWRKLAVHLTAAEPTLIRDFGLFVWYKHHNKNFISGMVPHDFENADTWILRPGRRGPKPAYWSYIKCGACHWLVNHNLELIQRACPKYSWRIITSNRHSTVFNGEDLLFDLNYFAIRIPPKKAYRLARTNGIVLPPGEHYSCTPPLD